MGEEGDGLVIRRGRTPQCFGNFTIQLAFSENVLRVCFPLAIPSLKKLAVPIEGTWCPSSLPLSPSTTHAISTTILYLRIPIAKDAVLSLSLTVRVMTPGP